MRREAKPETARSIGAAAQRTRRRPHATCQKTASRAGQTRRPQARRCRERARKDHRLSLQGSRPARARADPHLARWRAAAAPAAISGSNFSATMCSASSSPTCCSAPSPRPTRASCRAGLPIWCAGRPAPTWRARSISARRSGSARRRSTPAGGSRTAILADVCEALVGAVFLDGGYDAAAEAGRAAVGRAHARAGAAAARSEDHAAGMGAGARAADADLPRGRAHRAAPRSGVPRRRGAAEHASRPRASAAPSAPPSRRRPPPCSSAKA